VTRPSSSRLRVSSNGVVLASAAFLTLFANLAFFRGLYNALASSPWGWLHFGSLGLFLFCSLALFLLLFTWRPLFKPALFVLFFTAAVSAYFMDSYRVIIDSDMLSNVLATDGGEVLDLLSLRLLLYLLVLGVLPSIVLWRIDIPAVSFGRTVLSGLKLAFFMTLAIVALVLISSAFYSSFLREQKELRYQMNPLTPVYSVYKFGRTRLVAADKPLQLIGEDASTPVTDLERELVIMVVGETARADHFSLNGYERQTNPYLEQENVVSFTAVDACGTSTMISVPCMFSIEDREVFDSAEADSTENVLDVLTNAGVNVLWRDNNSNSKGVADRIRFEDFRDPENNPVCDEECRDVGMLAGLQEFIDQQDLADILIVLHQMGSHGPAYYKRYPPEFRKFTPTCDSNQLQECSEAEIGNSYDNTIVYTDYFLSRVIEFLRGNDDRFETVMLYASDHGESLGESGVYLHGMPYWLAPDAQTHVPVILWFGKNYIDADLEDVRQLRDKDLSHDNIFHTLLGLFEVQSTVYDSSKDILQQSRNLGGKPSEHQ